MDARDGIKARCKFLPTPADINELVSAKHKARDFVQPPRGYQKLEPGDDIVQPPGDRRKAQVLELLGYDPAAPMRRVQREELVPPSAEDIAVLGKVAKLQCPAVSDATPQLKELLMQPEEERLT